MRRVRVVVTANRAGRSAACVLEFGPSQGGVTTNDDFSGTGTQQPKFGSWIGIVAAQQSSVLNGKIGGVQSPPGATLQNKDSRRVRLREHIRRRVRASESKAAGELGLRFRELHQAGAGGMCDGQSSANCEVLNVDDRVKKYSGGEWPTKR